LVLTANPAIPRVLCSSRRPALLQPKNPTKSCFGGEFHVPQMRNHRPPRGKPETKRPTLASFPFPQTSVQDEIFATNCPPEFLMPSRHVLINCFAIEQTQSQ
jgi:hypothetical protein